MRSQATGSQQFVVVVLPEKNSFNRRYVRLKAMQNLYAFYVCKQASYECSLDQIRLAFTPDAFATLPTDPVQLAKDQAQALALFQSWQESKQAPRPEVTGCDSQIRATIEQVCSYYKNAVAQDLKKLQNGWGVDTNKIRQVCLYVLQLLLAWADIAQQQAGRTKLSQKSRSLSASILPHNRILARLRTDTAFIHFSKQHTVSWADKTDLVERWYNRFIRTNATLQYDSTQITTLQQDSKLLAHLLQISILEQEDIQEFFIDLDLSWTDHKRIVKKIICQALAILEKNTEKESTWPILESANMSKKLEEFYTNLINKTLTQEQELDILIENNSKNWAINRVMLLDKVILRLALCEIIYFDSIPIKVSINEYLDLSKIYSTPKSSPFINGILDTVAQTR